MRSPMNYSRRKFASYMTNAIVKSKHQKQKQTPDRSDYIHFLVLFFLVIILLSFISK